MTSRKSKLESRVRGMDEAIKLAQRVIRHIPKDRTLPLQTAEARKHALLLINWLDEIRWLAQSELDPGAERYE